MKNENLLADKHTPIKYLLHKYEVPTETADLPAGLNRLEVRALQVNLEGSAYDAKNKDFYSKLFQSTNVSVAGPYANNFPITNNRSKAYIAIC